MSFSPNVTKAAREQVAAKDAIVLLQDSLKKDHGKYIGEFNAYVDATLKNMKITDADPCDENNYVRVEYTSEFSLDDIAAVVKSVLEVVAARSGGGGVPAPATSPEAIEAYIGVVSAVAEAAKSSSSATSDMSYSANKVGPGTYVFLYCQSQAIKDEALFGTESITASAIYYRVINSLQAVQKSADFKLALIDYYLLDKWALLKEFYIDQLMNGDIDTNGCRRGQAYAEEEMRKARIRIKKAGLPPEQPVLMTAGTADEEPLQPSLKARIAEAQAASIAKLEKLAERGGEFAAFAKEVNKK